jgi:hypothetical protein
MDGIQVKKVSIKATINTTYDSETTRLDSF